MENQNRRILNYMRENGSITTMEAFTKLGVCRLGSRISELRSEGHVIAGTRESGKNRYGEKVNYLRYVLHE